MNDIPADFESLLEAASNNELTDEQFGRLQNLLDESSALRSAYVDAISLDADLWLGAAAVPSLDSASSLRPSREEVFRAGARQFSRGRARWMIASSLLGMFVVIAAWFISSVAGPRTNGDATSPVVVAQFGRMVNATWNGKVDASTASGASIHAGQKFELNQGIAELIFTSGARLIVQGPAVLEIRSDKEAFLFSGKLVGKIPPEAIGFKIGTHTTAIIDLGTEFGVEVDAQGRAHVAVLDGEVDVQRPTKEPTDIARVHPESLRLLAGESVRVSSDRVFTDIPFDPKQFVNSQALTECTRSTVIEESFAEPVLDPRRWCVFTHAPQSSVEVGSGGLRLKNRGFLATQNQYDPVALGGVRVTGKWRFESPEGATDNAKVNIFTVILRGSVKPGRWSESGQGISFRCYSNNQRATLHALGGEIGISPDRRQGSLRLNQIAAYEFEAIDDGRNLSFRLWESGNPKNEARATATVLHDATEAQHILFYCRERQPPNWNYGVVLEHLKIETGVGPCR